MSATNDSLDRIAAEYHAGQNVPDIHIENTCQEHFVEWLGKQIEPGMRVLDLGYGDGIVSAALAALPIKLTIVDGAKQLVAIAKNKHPHAECVHGLFETFKPAHEFDLVVASHVLEHVDDPRLVLRSIASWLSVGGKMIAVVPNQNSLHRQLAVLMGLQPRLDTLSPRDLMVGHQRVYSLEELTDDVDSSGLSVSESRGFFLKVLPNSMMLDYSKGLLDALNRISQSVPTELLANLVVVARRRH